MIIGLDGKDVREAPCPKCGASPDKREPSGGFGVPHLVCRVCAYEFKELKCPKVMS